MNAPTTFRYVAVAPDGTRRKGTLESDSAASVASVLAADGLVAVNIDARPTRSWNIRFGSDPKAVKLDSEQRVVFARQLYMMVRSGLSLARALTAIGEDHSNPRFVQMCNDLSERVLAGTPLSKALADYPKAFDEIFRAYISAGEQTGAMEACLDRLTQTLDKGHKLRLKVKAVTAYPKMVSGAIAILLTGIMLFLIPRYAQIYGDMGQTLPAPTRAMVKLSELIYPFHVGFGGSHGWVRQANRTWLSSPINFLSPTLWGVAVTVALVVWRRARLADIELGMKIEKLKFRTPLLGRLWKYQVLYRWSSTMAGALSSGLPMFSALDLAGRTSGSYWVQHVSETLKEAVRAGRPLSGELAKFPDLFNAQLRAMASTGEEAGEPAEMFQNVADTMQDELDALVAVLGARLEVALLVCMAVVVGIVVIVLYLPILNLSKATGNGFGGDF